MRIASYVAGAIVLVLLATGLYAVWTVRHSFPQTSGDIAVPGLRSDVTVLRDDKGVPQVYADNAEDLFFAQGYVQAQDRFFEMDFRRHVTSGRLSEWFRRDPPQAGGFLRPLGWRRVAEGELALLDPDTRRYLDAFSNGVNA